MFRLTLVFLLYLLQTGCAKRSFTIELDECDHKIFDNKTLKSLECHIVHSTNKPNKINGELVLSQNFSNIMMRVRFDTLRKDNTKMNIMNIDMDVCKFLDGRYSLNLAQVALRELRRVSNLPKHCPLIGHMPYIISNFTANPEEFPAFTPAMKWQIEIGIWRGNQLRGRATLRGQVQKI